MKRIVEKIKTLENDWLLVVTIMLLLPTGAAALMQKPLAWILELVFTVWIFFLIIAVLLKSKDK